MSDLVGSKVPGAADAKAALLPEAEERRDWPAWLLSVVLHATFLIACGLLAPAPARPPVGEADRIVGIALVPESRGADSSTANQGSSNAAEANSSSSPAGAPLDAVLSQLPDLQSLQGELATSLPQAGGVSAGTGAGPNLPAAGGLAAGIPGDRQKGKISGHTSTQVFGAQGTGNKFLYVFDRSASMGGFDGRPLATAKSELNKSLADLGAIHQFQILFYNDRLFVFNPLAPARPTMLFATDENRKLAQGFVRSITPAGGTNHLEALTAALNLSPDVIFFLTDADEPELSADELAGVRRKNRAATVIHCIEFGIGPFSGYENFLVKLARQNRGQHVYVDVTSLRAKE